MTALNDEHIITCLQRDADQQPIWVAYSGGLDSHVLVHLLAQHRAAFSQSIRLVHVNHGLHQYSDEWAAQCQSVAQQLDLPLDCLSVEVTLIRQLGLEAAARFARYQAIAAHIGVDAVLVTAQHQQDQAETMMLQLLRGAGALGLSAMQPISNWQQMPLIRPLLAYDRQAIEVYAQQHQLHWIEDPSNQSLKIRRNFLRHQIWPSLQQHWPALNQTLSRSAAHLSEAQQLLDERAAEDVLNLQSDGSLTTIDIPTLLKLTEARQRNVLRYIIRQLALALPSTLVLQKIINEVCWATADAMPLLTWSGGAVRRFRDKLYFMQTSVLEKPTQTFFINHLDALTLSSTQQLNWHKANEQGIDEQWIHSGLTLRYRCGGERIQLHKNGPHLSLKNLFQQWAIPPWQRDAIPLLFADDTLVAVVGYAICAEAQAKREQHGWLPTLLSESPRFFD